jgi:hypothetical protein
VARLLDEFLDGSVGALSERLEMSAEQSQEYLGNGNHKWEQVIIESGHRLERLRVPGGWLYRDLRTATLVFVPMPEVVKHKV